jgi:hypothetical protein
VKEAYRTEYGEGGHRYKLNAMGGHNSGKDFAIFSSGGELSHFILQSQMSLSCQPRKI